MLRANQVTLKQCLSTHEARLLPHAVGAMRALPTSHMIMNDRKTRELPPWRASTNMPGVTHPSVIII